MTSVRIGSAFKGWLLVAGGLTGALLLTYAGVVFGGQTFVLRDALRFTLPSREFLANSLADGHVPEWFDGVGFGVAFAANPVHGVTSPLLWLLAISSSSWAADALTLLQLLLMALGTSATARKLGATVPGACFSGLVLVMSGYVVSAIPNGNVPYLTWIPWLVWSLLSLGERQKENGLVSPPAGLTFTGAFALQLLSGEPGHTLVAGLLILIVLLVSERPFFEDLRRLLLRMGAGIGLAAIGVLPAALLLSVSARARYPSADPLKFSMHPGRLLELIWPLPFGSEGYESWFIRPALHLKYGDPAFAFSLYVGLPVLILAVAAARERRIRRLLLGSLAFLVLALGSYTPIYRSLRMIFPPLRWINYPEKFFYGVAFLWSVAAGVGLSRVLQSGSRRRWPFVFSAVGAALLATGALVVQFSRAGLESAMASRFAGANLSNGLRLSAAGAGVGALGGALFAAALFFSRRGARGTALVLTFVGTSAPLVFAAQSVTPLASRTIAERTPRMLAHLPRSPLAQSDIRPRLFLYPGPRIRPPLKTGSEIAADIQETLDTNVAARFGYDVIPGFETGDSARSRRFWEELPPRMSFLAFVRLLGVDFAMVPDPERYAPGFPIFAGLTEWGIVGTFPVRPRAFVAPRATPVRSAEEGLASLAWPGREGDPARIVVSGTDAEALDGRGPLEPCLVRSPRPEDVSLDCRSPNGGYAVLLDENLPGWSAELDGRPAKILTADGLFRAVRVGKGEHRVAFRYRTPGLRLGGVISLIMLAVIILSLIPVRKSHERG